MFLAGMLVFTTASLACALAPGFSWLLAARALQGVGAAFLMPASLAILGAAFSGEARGRAVGTWAAAGAVTGALGPLIGGWLIDAVGWRAIFLINLPIAAVAFWLAWRNVDDSRSDDAAPLDWGGAALATVGLGLLTFGLTTFAAHTASGAVATASSGVAAAAFLAGAVLLVGFVGLEARLGARAMMPLVLFGTRSFVGASLLTFFLYAALGGMLVLLPYLLIAGGGFSAAAAGGAMLPLSLAMGLGSRAAGRLAERTGPRLLLTVGPAIVAAGFALFLRIGAGEVSYVRDVLPALVVIAIGLALSVAPLTAAVMAAVDAGHVGSASGVNNAIARVAGLIATATLGFVLAGEPRGERLVAGAHGAAWVGCALALLAALSAWLLIAPRPTVNAGASAGRRSKRRDR